MTIDKVYQFVNFVANKEQRGAFTPAQFNMLAPIAQIEFISKVLGNEQLLNGRGLPPYGFKSNRKIDTLLRPLVVGPVTITTDTFTITNISKANPGVITFSSIGDLVNGSVIYISNVAGMTQVNGNKYMLNNISGNTAQLQTEAGVNVNTSAYSTYTSGGVARNGSFSYPSGFIWPDAVQKMDFKRIVLIDSDEYPELKHSEIHPPADDYPVAIFRDPKGFIDPISIERFKLSYLKFPDDPYWAYISPSGYEAIYTASGSVDFQVHQLGHLRICQIMLQAIGINLDSDKILQYSVMKEQSGT